MTNWKTTLWGRDFTLPVTYQCYKGEEILDTQREAFELLSKQLPADAKVKKPDAFAVALDALKQYIRDDDMAELPDLDIPNIFRYVVPTDIFLPHEDGHRIAAILCDYRFGIEHGLAVIFEDGKFKEIGPQDIVI